MSNVKSIRSEPFLWIHLMGVALFPIFVGASAIALSIGKSYPVIVELSFLLIVGVLPVFWMQVSHPFDIFSVLFVALKPECLDDNQKVILSLFKTFKQKLFSAIAAVMMTLLLWLLYRLSPLTTGIVDFLPQWRILGLGIAGASFFASNLFFQIPLSVLLVLLTQESKLVKIAPYTTDKIYHDFTLAGIKVDRILWFLASETDSQETI
ncbi:low-complexity tail membrane protein [Waterburya agarophytonicola K14]|uniref:Low-complexity tail membrane protein n=1 Tax=Waterburya agarophytonicola KI4 TaxID=2874699 RepID=A0A964FHU4_9CYAN|nr:low-complexity tail membrane protein [Waterburya agarophytonicola]MCC0177793.1 low-complexity tail membrane protein [Waterburya agarophytonicola KI4]